MAKVPDAFKDYFSFSRRERTGIFALIALIVLAAIWPAYWPAPKEEPVSPADKQALEELAAGIPLIKDDSGTTERPDKPLSKNKFADEAPAAGPMFYFDPNTATEAEWRSLGLRDKTIGTIGRYLAHGGRFKKAADISKVYGLRQADYERLLPWVKIKAASSERTNDYPYPKNERAADFKHTTAAIDINLADSAAWVALPGIGPALAGRILRFREKLGGFYAREQVGETWGLPDSVFQMIKPRLQCEHPVLRQLDINALDANTLRQHPYFRWNIANALVQYRNQHGPFASKEDLLRIALIDQVTLGKISPYLTLANPAKKE
jgi:DNA uptake protein ComE-like DNA-binding protein